MRVLCGVDATRYDYEADYQRILEFNRRHAALWLRIKQRRRAQLLTETDEQKAWQLLTSIVRPRYVRVWSRG